MREFADEKKSSFRNFKEGPWCPATVTETAEKIWREIRGQ